jgi:hypothetical protein
VMSHCGGFDENAGLVVPAWQRIGSSACAVMSSSPVNQIRLNLTDERSCCSFSSPLSCEVTNGHVSA